MVLPAGARPGSPAVRSTTAAARRQARSTAIGTSFNLENLTIETARPEDMPAVRELFTSGLLEGQLAFDDDGADLDQLEEFYFGAGGGSHFWIARHEDVVLGMIGVLQHEDHVAEIRRLRVHPDFRRRGVGAKLIETAIGFCRDHSYLKVILDTRIEREPAIRLFEKFGFRHARTRQVENRRLIDFYLDMYREPEE